MVKENKPQFLLGKSEAVEKSAWRCAAGAEPSSTQPPSHPAAGRRGATEECFPTRKSCGASGNKDLRAQQE